MYAVSSFSHFPPLHTPCNTQGQHVLRVTYEKLCAHGPVGDAVMREVLDFLQVDSSVTPSRLAVTVKQTSSPCSEAIVNYEDLRKAFKHHPKCRQLSWTKE
jgi:hypothetical protein